MCNLVCIMVIDGVILVLVAVVMRSIYETCCGLNDHAPINEYVIAEECPLPPDAEAVEVVGELTDELV